jgi:hypothetical protein
LSFLLECLDLPFEVPSLDESDEELIQAMILSVKRESGEVEVS